MLHRKFRFTLVILLQIVFLSGLKAQSIKVEDFSIQMTDASASTNVRLGDDQKPCSLLKIVSLNKDLKFEGNVVGDVVNKTNEYWVYIASNSSELIIKCPGLTSQRVKFSEYGIDKLQPKATYTMTVIAQPKPQLQANSKPVAATPQLSFEECKAAAKSGDPTALLNLGKCYLMGIGTTENPAEAVRYFEKAAAAGNVEALYRLGNSYYHGVGNFKDYDIAVSYYEKAASKGYAASLYSLGRCYEEGKGVSQNKVKAKECYKKAMDLGHSKARKAYDRL